MTRVFSLDHKMIGMNEADYAEGMWQLSITLARRARKIVHRRRPAP